MSEITGIMNNLAAINAKTLREMSRLTQATLDSELEDQQAAEAMFFLSEAGLDLEEVILMLPRVAQLHLKHGIEIVPAVEQASKALKERDQS